MARNYVLYNPLANSGRGEECLENILRELGGKAECYDVTQTDVRTLIQNTDPDDTVVLAGGDGTLNHFVNDVYGMPLPHVFMMRSGTGNDFLNDIEPPKGQVLVPLNKYIVDLPEVEVNGKTYRYVNNVAFGLDGAVCEAGDRQKSKGKLKINYTSLALKLMLFSYRAPNAAVTVDGETRHYKRVWLAPSMNGRYYGGGMMIAPMQNRLENILSGVVVHSAGRFTILRCFPAIFKGAHLKYTKIVDWRQGNEITVTFDRPIAVQIDGETIPNVLTYTARRAPAKEISSASNH